MTPEEIKDLRQLLGLSMEAFGARVGVRLLTIHRWESGKSNPHAVFVKAMRNIKKEEGFDL